MSVADRKCPYPHGSIEASIWNEGYTACVSATVQQLLAREARMREALEPFVRHGRALGVFNGGDGPFWIMTDTGYRNVPAEDFLRARQALEQPHDEG